MKFKPLGERALVKMVEREEQEPGGIVLPDTAKKKPQTAEVIEVGKFENGIKVGAGDVVVLRKYAGVEIKLDDEEYLIVDAEGLLGAVEDERRSPSPEKATGRGTAKDNPGSGR